MNKHYDLIIQGGGLTGLALAAAVGGAGARVLLVEERPIPTTTTAIASTAISPVNTCSRPSVPRATLSAAGAGSAIGAGPPPTQSNSGCPSSRL